MLYKRIFELAIAPYAFLFEMEPFEENHDRMKKLKLSPGFVSVVIPVFNDADNLDYCLRSLIRAKGQMPVEIIVVDDASSDSTPQIVRKFEVRYVRSDNNLGQSWARNYGAALTRSKYILFVDSDVVVPEDCFRQIARFIAMDKPKGLIGVQGVFSLEHPFREWPSLIYNTLQHLYSRKPLYNFGVNTSFFLISRQEFIDIGRFREDLWFMEDNEFAQRMAAMGKYVLHGLIQFVHRKRVEWRWFFRTFILGGKMQHVLIRMKPESVYVNTQPSVNVGVNRIFFKWLCGGLGIIAAFLLLVMISHPYLKMGMVGVTIAVCSRLLADCVMLLKVKRNPFFFFVGTGVYILSPWFVGLGKLLGYFSGITEKEQQLWKGKKLQGRD